MFQDWRCVFGRGVPNDWKARRSFETTGNTRRRLSVTCTKIEVFSKTFARTSYIENCKHFWQNSAFLKIKKPKLGKVTLLILVERRLDHRAAVWCVKIWGKERALPFPGYWKLNIPRFLTTEIKNMSFLGTWKAWTLLTCSAMHTDRQADKQTDRRHLVKPNYLIASEFPTNILESHVPHLLFV